MSVGEAMALCSSNPVWNISIMSIWYGYTAHSAVGAVSLALILMGVHFDSIRVGKIIIPICELASVSVVASYSWKGWGDRCLAIGMTWLRPAFPVVGAGGLVEDGLLGTGAGGLTTVGETLVANGSITAAGRLEERRARVDRGRAESSGTSD